MQVKFYPVVSWKGAGVLWECEEASYGAGPTGNHVCAWYSRGINCQMLLIL